MSPPSTTARFAPSPTGLLHIGHAWSAMMGWRAARAEPGGRFLLRIEDIDSTRCRADFEQAIIDDMTWLGLDWDGPVRRQSDHLDDYRAALAGLESGGLVYPCFCTRRQIHQEIAASASAPHGPLGLIYPGTCRRLSDDERRRCIDAGESYALRLDMAKAAHRVEPLSWRERHEGEIRADPTASGDIVIARKDAAASYHLAVTTDDHLQGVTLINRGRDLYHATSIHRVLQALRKAGHTPQDVVAMAERLAHASAETNHIAGD